MPRPSLRNMYIKVLTVKLSTLIRRAHRWLQNKYAMKKEKVKIVEHVNIHSTPIFLKVLIVHLLHYSVRQYTLYIS